MAKVRLFLASRGVALRQERMKTAEVKHNEATTADGQCAGNERSPNLDIIAFCLGSKKHME